MRIVLPPANFNPANRSRREVLRTGATALFGLPFLAANPSAAAEVAKTLFSAMGVAADLGRAEFIKSAGGHFITESVGGFLVPDKGDEEFAKNLEKLAASPLPVLACNGFIRPANLRCVGKEANHDDVLLWSETAFRRLAQAKGKFIVFGSAGSRALRDGWPKNKGEEQFVAVLKRMGPLAEKHGVTVVVEQLQPSECNLINHIAEAARLIRAAGHPNIRLLADLFHMVKSGDTPEDLRAAMDVVVHVEIAEKNGRTAPGVNGDDFRPFFRVLRDAKYAGAINIEAKFTDAQLAPAIATIARQAEEVTGDH